MNLNDGFFFFSSRRRHTRCSRDWSSDVCSSDLTGYLAGAVGLVLQDGRVVYQRAVGWADREAGRKMTPDAIFRIASQTKAITSAAALTLVEEGKLDLADPVSRYLPGFATTTVQSAPNAVPVPAKRPI